MSNPPPNTDLNIDAGSKTATTVAASIIDALQHPNVRLCNSTHHYNSKEAFPLLIIETQKFLAVIALQGAQLLEFKIKSSQNTQEIPLIWLSPKAIFSQGKAVRGGIPLCFPWFGAHPSDPSKPSHGFVRDRNWQLQRIELNKPEEYKLSFSVNSDQDTLTLFPYEFKAQLEFNLGTQIDIAFSVDNLSQIPMPCSWALHSYLPIQNIDSVTIEGLDGKIFLNTVGEPKQQRQCGNVLFNGELDRIYQQVGSRQRVNTRNALDIYGENCPSAIVWNPGTQLAAKMADLGSEASREFICLERGATLQESWNIPAGKRETAKIRISCAEQSA